MRQILLLISGMSCFALSSCSIRSQAYLRNSTNQPALIDVYILDKKRMQQLPDTVNVAMEVLPIEKGMYKKLTSIQTVNVKDSLHFTFNLTPQSTADLSDMVGEIWNGSWRNNVRVVVITANRADTIINGWGSPNKSKFSLYEKGLSDPIYYYDVK
jgi:hypothetical protein